MTTYLRVQPAIKFAATSTELSYISVFWKSQNYTPNKRQHPWRIQEGLLLLAQPEMAPQEVVEAGAEGRGVAAEEEEAMEPVHNEEEEEVVVAAEAATTLALLKTTRRMKAPDLHQAPKNDC